MAKKNVFPFVEPGLKTIDNDVINSLGPGEDLVASSWVANEEKNIDWFISPGFQLGVAYLYLDKKDHEVIIDFDQTPDDVYSELSGNTANFLQFLYGPGREASSLTSKKIDVDRNLIAGSIFCVGVKNRSSKRTIRNFTLYSLVDAPDFTYTIPFKDHPSLAFSLTSVTVDEGDWMTFMFTGTRFVFLGSNNWV